MTTEAVSQERHDQHVTIRRKGLFTAPPVHLSWGAIFAGTVVGLATWTLLYAFGLAVGLTAIDPHSPNSLRASGVFTGIWSLVVPIAALFVGGAVASRGADVVTTLGGALHGLAVWGLVTVIGAWMFTSIVLAFLGTVGSAAAAAGPALGSAWLGQGRAAAVETLTQPYEWEAADALGPVNQRLQAEGRAPMRPEQIEAVAAFVIADALRSGELNRESAVMSITRTTPLTRAEAETVASRLEARWNESKRAAQVAALQAAETTGRAFWGVFGVLTLGLLSALAGSMIGVSKRPRAAAGSVTAPPIVPHEVHA